MLFDDKRESNRHGGEHSRGKRKGSRPIDRKRPIHVVFRSSLAKGPLSLMRHSRWIQQLAKTSAEKWGVRVYEVAVNSTHVHLLIRGKNRQALRHFFRAFAGTVAMKVTGARKGKAFGKRFWDDLVFTRLAHWGRAFQILRSYILQNQLEALGVIAYQVRAHRRE